MRAITVTATAKGDTSSKAGKEGKEGSDSDLPAGLAKPAQRALQGAGVTRLEELACMRERDVRQLHGMGRAGLRLLREAMAARGLCFTEGET